MQVAQVRGRDGVRSSGAATRLRRVVRDISWTLWGQLGWIALLTWTILLTFAAAGPNVLAIDVTIARAVQHSDFPGLSLLAAFVAVAGDTPAMFALAAVAIAILARAGHYAAIWPVAGALALRCGNALIKAAADSPRPTAQFVPTHETPHGNGFPSAHVMGVVLLYGVLFVLAGELIRRHRLRLAVQSGAVAMILAIGVGRIYTGAHWPTDVLGAYLYGFLFLFPLIASYRVLRDALPRVSLFPAARRLAFLPVTRKP